MKISNEQIKEMKAFLATRKQVEILISVYVPKNAEDYEIESHIRDALTLYEGNDLEFSGTEVKGIQKYLE